MIDRFIGIDFSGAEQAGDSIWIAEASVSGDLTRIEHCRPASQLPGSGRTRGLCLPALVEFIGGQEEVVVGCDFPFSLPMAMIDGSSWRRFAIGFGARFPSPESFLNDCRRRGNGREIKRACDRDSRVPFAAYNLRIYRQTFYGIRDVLAPLVAGAGAVVLPMQKPLPARPWVIETCPASTLKKAGLYQSYKGAGAAARAARGRIVDGLVARCLMAPLRADMRRLALENAGGDALDSMIAAAATANAFRLGVLTGNRRGRGERIEGRVYF